MSDSMSAIEYENLEQKYMETKSKLKKTLQYNERYTIQIQKLNKKLKRLENENRQLEQRVSQLQATNTHDTSESDVSSPANLQRENANMMDLIHSKNQQISDLLKDIEEVENENIILRDKLAETKDQLAVATKEIAAMTETFKSYEVQDQEKNIVIEKISLERDQVKGEFQITKQENNTLKDQLKTYADKLEEKESEWKVLLDEKEKEADELKALLSPQDKTKSSIIPKIEEQSDKESRMREVDHLKATLLETEDQLDRLKKEMENCTDELKESVSIINKLKCEKELLKKKIKDTKENERDIKEQLRKAHDRSQCLQKEVEYANKMTKIFEADLTTIKNKMKENGQLDTVINLEEIQTLKIEKLLHEKQIVGLVKDINKLQEMCNIFEIENVTLRQELGLSAEENIDIDKSFLTESKKQARLIDKLQLDNRNIQEEKLKLKLEIKRLRKLVSAVAQESMNTEEGSNIIETEAGLLSKPPKTDQSYDVKTLSEENEALRKGLHEILNSVQIKNETSPRELKSKILEKLLRALDVKHISGWYHPAMRLQAELHTLEGINTELREQLHEARMELDKLKSTSTHKTELVDNLGQAANETEAPVNNVKYDLLENVLNSDVSCLEKIKINVMNIITYFSESEADIESKLESEFEFLKQNLELLHSNCHSVTGQPLETIDNLEKDLEFEPRNIDPNMSPGELTKVIEEERRKSKNIFKKMYKLQEELSIIKSSNNTSSHSYLLETEMLLKKISLLHFKLRIKDKQLLGLTDAKTFKTMRDSLNNNMKNYRQLLSEVAEREDHRHIKLETLRRVEGDLSQENSELKEQLTKTLNQLNQETYKQDQNVLPLSQRLANAEIQAMSEKHRADHINNLYELVKEQLNKSEEKFVEFSKYGDGLLQKNLVLQDRIVNLEDQLTISVDPELYNKLQEDLNSLVKERDQLTAENVDLSKKYHECIESRRQASAWTKEKEQELLGLKHEVIDLTSASDDKSLMDQLYCDLTKVRSELREHQLQADFLRKEILNWESRYTKIYSEMDGQRSHFEAEKKILDKKIGILQDVILKQRVQYHGCTPLIIQELLVEKLQTIHKERHEAFISLHNAKMLEDKMCNPEGNQDQGYNSQQIQYLQQKIQNQDLNIEKLERELFSAYKLLDINKREGDNGRLKSRRPILVREVVLQESVGPFKTTSETSIEKSLNETSEPKMVILRNVESQTEFRNEEKEDKQLTVACIQLNNLQNQLSIKDNYIAEKERLLLEKDEELSKCREQLQSLKFQVTGLETSLADFQNREKYQVESHHNGAAGDGANLRTDSLNDKVTSLRVALKAAQEKIKQKDVDIMKYQTLLKEDRDKHSLAAINLQQELNILRKTLVAEQQNNKSLQQESAISRQKSTAVEKYVSQVRALETHMAELHTQLAQLQAQLQNANQEAARWRQMAQDRLVAMQKLGKSLNEQHNKELSSYKTDYEKLKELSEDEIPKKISSEHKFGSYIDPDILKLCREKDERIEQLTAKLKQLENGKNFQKPTSCDTSFPESKLDSNREHEILRGKYESMVNKERSLKEEVRELKEQLSKRSNLSARSQKSERTVKEQQQRRIQFLERQVDSLNEKLAQQLLLNEKHKLSANEDFEKWKKQKYWQESCQKYKAKLGEAEEEVRKLQQTCTGYRMLIERLEREKINLENRIKSLKSDHQKSISDQENVQLKDENDRLLCEIAALQTKMEMRQQGSGVLGAALMQEKLEAQERKIAILELSAKGTVEVRNELERLQTSISNLQKSNLCLEAENMELKMDQEKYSKEMPRLQEQVQHLESYIELLKDENQRQSPNSDDVAHVVESSEHKKVSQLERTIFILKRVVEKLQVENKRLVSGKRPLSERSPSADKLRRDYIRLKEQHTACLQRIKELESQLKKSQKKPGNEKSDDLLTQLTEVKEQLFQKTQLLDKVKTLLHTAAAREKQLLKQIAELKCAANMESHHQVDIPSTIEEVSESSSDV